MVGTADISGELIAVRANRDIRYDRLHLNGLLHYRIGICLFQPDLALINCRSKYACASCGTDIVGVRFTAGCFCP